MTDPAKRIAMTDGFTKVTEHLCFNFLLRTGEE
jgi:hypothetical protein